MTTLSLELFLASFVAPVVALILILAVAQKLRHTEESRRRRAAAQYRQGAGFNRPATLKRAREHRS